MCPHLRLAFACLLWFFVFSTAAYLSADDLDEDPTAGICPILVNGTVNPLTGHFVDNVCDLVVAGPVPLTLARSYSSNDDSKSFLHCGWHFNHPHNCIVKSEFHKKWSYVDVWCREPNGFTINYYQKANPQEKTFAERSILEPSLPHSVTNCNGRSLNARSYLPNNRVHYISYDKCTLTNGGGDVCTFVRPSDPIDIGFLQLKSFKRADGTSCSYKYFGGYDAEVSYINAHSKGGHTYASFNFRYRGGEHDTFAVHSDDGRKATYRFRKHFVYEYRRKPNQDLEEVKVTYYYLKQVNSSEKCTEYYHYTKRTLNKFLHVRAKEWHDRDHYLLNEYYHWGENDLGDKGTIDLGPRRKGHRPDSRLDRIRLQKAPVGVDTTPVITHRYLYQKLPRGGITDVFDAYNNHTAYHYTGCQRLQKVERFNAKGELCHVASYRWGGRGLLESKVEADGFGNVWAARSFEYDAAGNVVRETSYGNFSGTAVGFPVVDAEGRPSAGDAESYTVWKRYGEAPYYNLIAEGAEGADDALEAHYSYCPDSNLLAATYLIAGGKTVWRAFKIYNADGLCVEEVADDGCGRDCGDLEGVTLRKLVRRRLKEANPGYGLPKEVEECYLDLATGQAVPLRCTRYEYDAHGRVASSEVRSGDGSSAYLVRYRRDARGNVVEEGDSYGYTTKRSFDPFDRVTMEVLPGGMQRAYRYDFAGRCIGVEEDFSQGRHTVTQHRYDWLSQKTATVDGYGQETSFRYDSLGRLIEQIDPPVAEGHSGAMTRPVHRWEYDTLGRPVVVTDPLGRAARMRYTQHGHLCEKVAPDGSCERRTYTPRGLLAAVHGSDGSVVRYRYDAFGNRVAEEAYGADGSLLTSQSWQWRDGRLLVAVDAGGCVTEYSYDGAGRRSGERCGNRYVVYRYSPLGRLVEERRGEVTEGEGSEVVTTWQHDLRGRVAVERTADAAGRVQRETAYVYDAGDRCLRTAVTAEGADGHAVTTTVYDGSGRVSAVTDPAGHTTHVAYKVVPYAGGGTTLAVETTDPHGCREVELKDPAGRTVSIERYDSLGTLLARTRYAYDLAGQRLAAHVAVVVDGDVLGEQVAAWEYDDGGRVVVEVHARGAPEQYSLQHSYDSCGRRVETIKADGVRLMWEYDVAGRLASFCDSEGSVAYRYSYDAVGRLVGIFDAAAGTTLCREYDSLGNLVREGSDAGVSMAYSYDALSRPRTVTYPDGSRAIYSYRGQRLSEVARVACDGSASYSCRYTAYDRNGCPTEAEFTGAAEAVWRVRWGYDACGRMLRVEARHFRLWIDPKEGYDAVGNLTACTVSDPSGSYVSRWQHDAVGQVVGEEGAVTHSYRYESLGNRNDVDGRRWHHDIRNRLMEADGRRFEYDVNGNLVDDGCRRYSYDALDRLVGVVDSSGGAMVRYRYDHFHRRIASERWKRAADGSDDSGGDDIDGGEGGWQKVDATYFLYSGVDEIGAVGADGKIRELRILGAGGLGAEIGAGAFMEFDGVAHVPLCDYSGSVRCLVRCCDGTCAAHYRYDTFGNVILSEGVICEVCQWRFSSKRCDIESGLVYFGRRYYDPQHGRWTTLDPAGYGTGPNGYLYVGNAPCTHVDLYGLYELATGSSNGGSGSSFPSSYDDSNSIPSYARMPPYHVEPYRLYPSNPFEYLCERVGLCFSFMAEHLLPVPLLRDLFGFCGHVLRGHAPRSYCPSWHDPSSSLAYVGTGSKYSDVAITLTTGMLNGMDSALGSAALVSKMFDNEQVLLVHNSTWGFLADLGECVLQKVGIPTHSVQVQVYAFKWALARSKLVLAYAHSQGALIVKNALAYLSPEEKKRVHVRTFGAASIIHSENIASVANYISWRDPVPFLADAVGTIYGLSCGGGCVQLLESDCTLPIDHSFNSSTYLEALRKNAVQFIEGML